MIVLGIETSCDETAAAVVDDDRTIWSNVVYSQLDEHIAFEVWCPKSPPGHISKCWMAWSGGQCRMREWISRTSTVLRPPAGRDDRRSDRRHHDRKSDGGRGNKPYVAVNHLEGHALTARLTDDLNFPYLLLLVSGGHCQLLSVEGPGAYEQLGSTVDDAIGEAFDKSAKMIGLGFPGGPAIEAAAQSGDARPISAPNEGSAGLRFFVFRTQDVSATGDPEDRFRHIVGADCTRHRRLVPGGCCWNGGRSMR